MNKVNVLRQIKQKNHSKPQGQGSIGGNELDKEMAWDPRFHLAKLPDYNAFSDTNYLSIKGLRDQIRHMESVSKKRSGNNQNSSAERRQKSLQMNEMIMSRETDSLNEELNVVQTMWDDLGVTDEYRYVFDSIARELEGKYRKDLFDLEISSLMRLSDNLTKLLKEVQSREKSIVLLRKFEEAGNKELELTEKMLNDLIQCIKNIRIQSINIVNHFSKIREICSYSVIGGKFDLEKISKLYIFDRNYLIKMKFDLDFLKGSVICNYVNINDDSDPFLVSTGEEVEGKHCVNINEDMLDSIKQCQFSILQDLIFYQIQTINLEKKNSVRVNNNRSKSPPGKYKINYPLAKDMRWRISSPPNHSRPSTTSNFGFYNLNLNKHNNKYNNLFFNKEGNNNNKDLNFENNVNNLVNNLNPNQNIDNTGNQNIIKTSSENIKRIQTENKEKEMVKTIDNFKTFQNINLERNKQNMAKQMEESQKGGLRDSKNNHYLDENLVKKTYMEGSNKDKIMPNSPNSLNSLNSLSKSKETKIIEKLNYESKKDNNNNNNNSSKGLNPESKPSRKVNNENKSILEYSKPNTDDKNKELRLQIDINNSIEDKYNFNEINEEANHVIIEEQEVKIKTGTLKKLSLKDTKQISNNNNNNLQKETISKESSDRKITETKVINSKEKNIKSEELIKNEKRTSTLKELAVTSPRHEDNHEEKNQNSNIGQNISNISKTNHKEKLMDIQNEIDNDINYDFEENIVEEDLNVPVKDVKEENKKQIGEVKNNTKGFTKLIAEVAQDDKKTTTPKDVREFPIIKEETLLKEDKFISKKEEKLISKNEVPILKEDKLISIKEEPIFKEEKFISKKEVPILQEEKLISKKEEPILKEEKFISKKEVPILKEEKLISKKEVPILKEEKLISKNELPLLKEEKLISKNEVPLLKEEKFISKQEDNKLQTNFNIVTTFFNKTIEELIPLYSNYYKHIPKDQLISFKPSESVKTFLKGVNPKILLAHDENSNLIGMCCVTLDSSCDTSLRLYINHISTTKTEYLEHSFIKFIESIFSNITCDEIMIEIHYEFSNGAFNLDKHIFSILKDKLKFKWSNLENKTAQDRLQKMCLKNINSKTSDFEKLDKHCLRVKYTTVLKIEEAKEINSIREVNKKEQEINMFPLIYSLVDLTNEKYNLENENFKKFNSTNFKGIMSSSIGDRQKIILFLDENKINSNLLNKNLDFNLHSSIMNVNSKFTSLLTTPLSLHTDSFLYNRIEQSSYESLIDEATSQVFHVIPTGDGFNSIVIAQLNTKFKQFLEKGGENICKTFFDLYPKLENQKNNFESDSHVIWVPCFNITGHVSYPQPNIMSDVIIKKDEQDFQMSLLDEFKDFKFFSDKQFNNSIKVTPSTDDIVIDNAFLISLVNLDILAELNIPSMFLQIVSQDKWTKTD